MAELHVHVAGYPDSDDEERAELAWRLGEEIREHGIDRDDPSGLARRRVVQEAVEQIDGYGRSAADSLLARAH